MRKRTSTNSRNNLSIVALSLMLGFISISPTSASNGTNYERSKIQTSENQKTAQIKSSTKDEDEEKQEKVNVILNGDTIVSYAAVGNDTTDLSEESRTDSAGVTNVHINGKDVKIDKDDINKIFSISERLENIVYTLGNSTFGSIIGVLIGLVVATLAIVFVIFVLGFPIWIVLFILWLYRRIKRNREDQRKDDEASFAYRRNYDQESKQDSGNDFTNDSTNDFSQNLNRGPNDNNYREATIAANNMIESSIMQIFAGLGVGFFLYIFISSTMGIAIGGLILLVGVGKYMSGKQRLKNIKEYREDRKNNYSPKDNQRAKQEGQKKEETNQQDQSVEDVTPQSTDNDNRQQL